MTTTTETAHRRRWDHPGLHAAVLETVLATPRRPLHELDLRRYPGPGAYVLFLATDNRVVVETFSPILAHATYPWYGGSARALGPRLRRYAQSLQDVRDLGHTDLWVCPIPTPTHAGALYAEASLIEALGFLGNRLGGFGAKIPGARRRTQAASPFDTLLPGRGWVRPPSIQDQVRARATVVSYLAALDPAGPRWAPLIP